MSYALAIACGVVCGIAVATPLMLQLRKGDADIGKGFGAVIAAFLGIQLAMFVVLRLWPGLTAQFGISATLAFLALTMVGVLLR